MSEESYLTDIEKFVKSYKSEISNEEKDFAFNVKAIENLGGKEFQNKMATIKNERINARMKEFRRRKQQDRARERHMLKKKCEKLGKQRESLRQEIHLYYNRTVLMEQRNSLQQEIYSYRSKIRSLCRTNVSSQVN